MVEPDEVRPGGEPVAPDGVGDDPVLAPVSWFVPSRWAFAMGASTAGFPSEDPLWEAAGDVWLFDLVVLVLLGALSALLTGTALRRSRLGPRSTRR